MKKLSMLALLAIVTCGNAMYAMDEETLNQLVTRQNINWEKIFNTLGNSATAKKTVNAYRANNGDTLLFIAAFNNNTSAVAKLLREYSANPNAPGRNRVTPLMWACENKNVEMVRLLLSYGADPRLVNGAGETCVNYLGQYWPPSQTIRHLYTDKEIDTINLKKRIYDLIKEKL